MTPPFPFHITIARQLGSGGSYLGQMLANRMGYSYLDGQILQTAAEELGMHGHELAHREERIQNFWTHVLEKFATGSPEYLVGAFPPPAISDEEFILAEKRALLSLAGNRSCVIIGRGGFHYIGCRGNALHVFIHAPKKFRIDRLIKFYGVKNETEAERMIDASDRDRERYIHRISQRSWYDARNYHLSLDMSLISYETAESFIISLCDSLSKGRTCHASDG